MNPAPYSYQITLPDVGAVRITPCGVAELTATSDRIDVPGVAPFYVHCLRPVRGPAYYQLTGCPGQWATLGDAVAAHLAPLEGPR